MKTYINVSYSDKELAKGLGARWDKKVKSWYVPDGYSMNNFNQWLKGAKQANQEKRILSESYGVHVGIHYVKSDDDSDPF